MEAACRDTVVAVVASHRRPVLGADVIEVPELEAGLQSCQGKIGVWKICPPLELVKRLELLNRIALHSGPDRVANHA